MGQQTISRCDVPGCKEMIEGVPVPAPPGWVRRTVIDSIGPSQSGANEFSGHQQFLYCPTHSGMLVPVLSGQVLAELGRREKAEAAKLEKKSGD